MTTLTYQKTANVFFLTGVAGVITMPDVAFGLMLDLLHSLFELVHLLFEFVEATLDHVVEHIFHTNVHQTQIIVFYLLLSMAFGGLYYLWRITPCVYCKVKDNLQNAWLQRKKRLFIYWAEQSLINKIKLIALFNAGLTCVVLFGF